MFNLGQEVGAKLLYPLEFDISWLPSACLKVRADMGKYGRSLEI